MRGILWTLSHRQRLLKVTAIRIDNTIYRFMLAKHENLIAASNLFKAKLFYYKGMFVSPFIWRHLKI